MTAGARQKINDIKKELKSFVTTYGFHVLDPFPDQLLLADVVAAVELPAHARQPHLGERLRIRDIISDADDGQ